MCDFETLTSSVKNSVLEAIWVLSMDHPDDKIAGCALFTEDSLSGFFPMLCLRSEVIEKGDSCLFQPIDWEYEPDESLDRGANEMMAKWSNNAGDNFADYVQGAFGALVAAVDSLRAEGILSSHVFVTVGSTDPSDLMERLERDTILSRNSRPIVRRWLEFELRGSEEWMEKLKQKEQPLSYAEQDTLERLENEVLGLSEMLANFDEDSSG